MVPSTAVVIYIFLATFGIFIFSLVMFCRLQKKRHYQCAGCGYCFKPGGITAFFARRENVTDRLLFCPRCGYRSFMKNIDDSEDDTRKDTRQDDPERNDTGHHDV